jgi:hypothetical protein
MKTTTTSNTTKTILTISMGFLVIFLIGNWNWALMVSLGVGFIGMFSSFLSQKIEWIWMKITLVLSYIVPNILLSAVFYLLLFPIAVLSRIFGKKDVFMLKGGRASIYIIRNKIYKKDDFTHPW